MELQPYYIIKYSGDGVSICICVFSVFASGNTIILRVEICYVRWYYGAVFKCYVACGWCGVALVCKEIKLYVCVADRLVVCLQTNKLAYTHYCCEILTSHGRQPPPFFPPACRLIKPHPTFWRERHTLAATAFFSSS